LIPENKVSHDVMITHCKCCILSRSEAF